MKWVAAVGALLGSLLAVLVFAPASWLAAIVTDASNGQLQLADARGTVWRGSAQVVLSGGTSSREAMALPGRLSWRLRPRWSGLELQAQQPCCLHPRFRLLVSPGFAGTTVQVPAQAEALLQWPAAWLVGLGAPWNTLQPSGTVRLNSAQGISWRSAQGRLAFSGGAELHIDNLASRLAPLASVGSYRLHITAQPNAGDSARLSLATLKGPLQLSGEGQWGGTAVGTHVRFRGLAQADAGSEAALANLLNLIGRRQGATSVLNIG